MSEEENNVALFAWLAKQVQKDEEHRQMVVRRRAQDDELYVDMLAEMLTTRELNNKTRILCLCFAKHKHEGKNFTNKQRSAITNIYYK